MYYEYLYVVERGSCALAVAMTVVLHIVLPAIALIIESNFDCLI